MGRSTAELAPRTACQRRWLGSARRARKLALIDGRPGLGSWAVPPCKGCSRASAPAARRRRGPGSLPRTCSRRAPVLPGRAASLCSCDCGLLPLAQTIPANPRRAQRGGCASTPSHARPAQAPRRLIIPCEACVERSFCVNYRFRLSACSVQWWKAASGLASSSGQARAGRRRPATPVPPGSLPVRDTNIWRRVFDRSV